MTTLLDYLVWRGDLSFSQDPFNEVDNLILAELCYFDFGDVIAKGETVTLENAARRYLKLYPRGTHKLGLMMTPAFDDFLILTAQTKRFSEIKLSFPVNIIKKRPAMQFAAITYELPTKDLYVAFRGTDDHIVAWKESLSLAVKDEIPAHKAAVAYLNAVLQKRSENMYVGGHSKGGNLAMYAALKIDPSDRCRILKIYNNDGPGFRRDQSENEAFLAMKDKLHWTTPYLSVVGAMLEHGENAEVIESSGKGLLLQHDAFTWRVRGNAFVRLPARSEESRKLENAVKAWTEKLGEKEQKHFIDTLYHLLTSSGAETLSEIGEEKIKSAYKATATLFTLKKETRDLVAHALLLFFRERRNAIRAEKAKKD
ncbi:MAG: DUF2974 domain-containing protein [Clostridia bacterium]|nr:DUF2974 domain-containing protein [Clostridia bacterium]